MVLNGQLNALMNETLGVSGALLRHGANVEDSRMAILGGHFTMMLIVSTPGNADHDSARCWLSRSCTP